MYFNENTVTKPILPVLLLVIDDTIDCSERARFREIRKRYAQKSDIGDASAEILKKKQRQCIRL